MKKKSFILFSLAMLLAGAAWSAKYTPHQEYKSIPIKDCNECHTASGIAPNHNSAWITTHRLIAEKKPSNCKDCHQLSFCSDCHYGGGLNPDLSVSNFGVDYMPKTHRSDFREIHPIKAFDDPRSCYRCHDARKFCDECHQKFAPADLASVSHRKGFSDIQVSAVGPSHANFKPSQCPTCHPNSILPQHQWSSEHAREARKNLAACQSCHPSGDVCLKCHSAISGLKINPHPRNWGSISTRLSGAGNNRSCIKCH
ncbi:MAG: hypothetical protein M0Z59_00090 [Nitrospiraceae bacterium]|nr:hypothetical protein [Nitrospiraceae bacterium]